jgi:hypothetical protein
MGDQTERNEFSIECGTYGGRRDAYRVLAKKPEAKRLLEGPKCKWENNIKMDLYKYFRRVWTGFFWLCKRRVVVKAVMRFQVL